MDIEEYRQLAAFRYELRRFLRYSEQITRRKGLTPLQYQLLLRIKGCPNGGEISISHLAERLQAKHHGVVALATRCERLGLVQRQAGRDDRRQVHLRLTPKGERALEGIVGLHRHEQAALLARLVEIRSRARAWPTASLAGGLARVRSVNASR
jgi:DNA-binding MarR family transcriptional regulator